MKKNATTSNDLHDLELLNHQSEKAFLLINAEVLKIKVLRL